MTWYFNTDRLGRDSNSYYSKLEQEIQYIIENNTEYPKLSFQRNVFLWRNFEDIISIDHNCYQGEETVSDGQRIL